MVLCLYPARNEAIPQLRRLRWFSLSSPFEMNQIRTSYSPIQIRIVLVFVNAVKIPIITKAKRSSRMKLHIIPENITVCKIQDTSLVDFTKDYTFLSRTDEELSLVCPTEYVPSNTIAREDGWRGFRFVGVFEFTLVGVLSPILKILADAKIGIFAISTYNTDYVLVKSENFDRAIEALSQNGYVIE